ncbi:MAG: WecB/TagA/CpsF family glycosyltransferase, partial [Candidatus Staskawiczbacteria bacterium]
NQYFANRSLKHIQGILVLLLFQLLLSKKDQEFKNILDKSKLNTADGSGLMWASKFLTLNLKNKTFLDKTVSSIKCFFSLVLFLFYKKPFLKIIKERIPGSELIYDITKVGNELNKKIFLLGSDTNEELDLVENRLNKFLESENVSSFTNIVAGKDIGFSREQSMLDQEINNKLIEKINKSKAEILFVSLSAPKQEKWISSNLEKLENIKMAIGLGGTFDFVSGYKKRAPAIFQTLGLEWLFRLFMEPKIRWKRILNAVVKFPIEVLKEKIK